MYQYCTCVGGIRYMYLTPELTPKKLLLHGKIDALCLMALKNVGIYTLIGNKRFTQTGAERRTMLFQSEGLADTGDGCKWPKKDPRSGLDLMIRSDLYMIACSLI